MSALRGFLLLKQRDFAAFLLARLLGNIGAQMQTVAVGWWVYAKTAQPLDLGLIGLSQFLPFVLLILPAGHCADRFDRRRIMALCYAVQCICALGLLLFVWWQLEAVWPVFVVMSLLGVARAFAMPAGQALLPNLVPREQFSRAVAFSGTVFQVSTIVGPLLGGVLLLAGSMPVFVLVAICAALAVVSISRIDGGGLVSASLPTTPQATGLAALLSGFGYVRSQPLVLGAISLDLFAVLFGGATALLPVFARDVLQVGPSGLGAMRAATGVGAVLCALWLTAHPIHRHVGPWLFGSVMMFGLATIVFGTSTHYGLSLVALFVMGAADMMSVFVRGYLVQVATPDHIRGRVSAISSVFIGASNELGEFESGTTAAWWGAVPAVVVGGCATVIVSLGWMKLFPALRHLDRMPEPSNS